MHNYKVGDKVVIVEEALGINPIWATPNYITLGKVGTIIEMFECKARIDTGRMIFEYYLNQFKPYVEEQKPEHKFKVDDVIESTDGLVIGVFNDKACHDVDVIHLAKEFKNRSLDKWKLYKYGVGDEVKLNEAYRYSDTIFIPFGKIISFNKNEVLLDFNYDLGNGGNCGGQSWYNKTQFTLIKSARWVKENLLPQDISINPEIVKLDKEEPDLLKMVCKKCNKKIKQKKIIKWIKEYYHYNVKGYIDQNIDKDGDPLDYPVAFEARYSGFINNKLHYVIHHNQGNYPLDKENPLEIRFNIILSEAYCNKYGEIYTDSIWEDIPSIKKAKKYALKHYMENNN